MKEKILKHKKVLIITSIVVAITIIATVSFNYLKTKEKEVAKIDNLEEKNIEEPDGEYIDIEDLEQENEEETEEQGNQNIIKN